MKNRSLGRVLWDSLWALIAVAVGCSVGWYASGLPETLAGRPVMGFIVVGLAVAGFLIGCVGTIEAYNLTVKLFKRRDLLSTFSARWADPSLDDEC